MQKTIITKMAALLIALSLAACNETSAKPDAKESNVESGHPPEAGHKDGEAHQDEDGKRSIVKLTEAQIALAEIKVAPVARGDVHVPVTLTGEVALNQERLAHIQPRVPGYVREIHKTIGEPVRAGETLATIESRELAELKNAYLIARERAALAQNKFSREEQLWKQKISSQQEYFDARQGLAEATLELRTAEQNLQSVGVDTRSVGQDGSTMYRVTTPIDGAIIEWNVALGQKLDAENKAFVVADLANLWVFATVNTRDIGRIRVGQPATVTIRSARGERYPGKVTWVADVIDEKSRTLKVRIEAANPERRLKPGMFVTVDVAAETRSGVVAVPPSAIQAQRGESVVFVQERNGQYARREVKLGIRTADAVEVSSGLTEGEPIVVDGGFTLKSELEKAGFEGGHGH